MEYKFHKLFIYEDWNVNQVNVIVYKTTGLKNALPYFIINDLTVDTKPGDATL